MTAISTFCAASCRPRGRFQLCDGLRGSGTASSDGISIYDHQPFRL